MSFILQPWQLLFVILAALVNRRQQQAFERFGIGFNWWDYSGGDIYRTGLVARGRESPNVAVLKNWFARSCRGLSRRKRER